jgi:hypothetical protein
VTSPGPDEAARDRVAALLEWATHIPLDVATVALPDAERLAARERAVGVAKLHHRQRLLVEAVAAARETVLRSFAAGGFSGTWAATDWSISVASGTDRVAAAAALEEAAVAMILQDIADAETVEVLAATWDNLVRLRGVPVPGALSQLTAAFRTRRPGAT